MTDPLTAASTPSWSWDVVRCIAASHASAAFDGESAWLMRGITSMTTDVATVALTIVIRHVKSTPCTRRVAAQAVTARRCVRDDALLGPRSMHVYAGRRHRFRRFGSNWG